MDSVEDNEPTNNEPQESDWIYVTSTDGFSYLIRRKLANTSGTLKSMLDPESNYSEASSKTCAIPHRGIIAEKALEYQAFKAHYESAGPKEDIPTHEFMERVPPEISLELLLAADYLEL